MLEILVTKSFSVSQNPTWRPQGHWCYLIVSHVREEVASFLGFLLGISATFNMCGQLYRGHTNATALFSSPVVSALGSESDNLGSSPGWDKALRCAGKKNASSASRLG